MNKSLKALLLVAVGGACLSLFIYVFYPITKGDLPWKYSRFFVESLSMFLIGAVITAVFGVPFLLLIDKYFGRYWFRYIVGGGTAAFVLLFLMTGPMFNPEKYWLSPMYWFDPREFCFVVGMGLAVGTVFTALLTVIERWKRKKP